VVAVEVAFTVPGAHEIIAELAKSYSSSDILLGAGTVLDSETARIAILSGAQYIVSPYLSLETMKLCHRYRVPIMPGAMTIKEVAEAMEAGADIVKLFPGELFGPAFVKAIRGPLPHARLMPTGGVSVENVGEWIKAGCVAVGVGGNLTAGAKSGDYASITTKAKHFLEAIRRARS
jgi:2-dehydro-3-deoxyphosphogluconate aldolase/(4S)-4-hydroxy-2-oxoglutarate aldolase